MRMTKKRRVYEAVRRLGVSRPCLLVTNGDLVQETVDYTEKLVMKETVPFQRTVIVYNLGSKRGDLRRLNELLKERFGKSPLTTVHALAYKVLTRYLRKEYRGNVQPVLAVGTKQEEIARAAMGLAGIEMQIDKINAYLKKIRGAKVHLFYPPFTDSASNIEENEFFKFYDAYEKILQQKKVFDYEDIIGHAFSALRDNPWLIEEFRFKYRYIIAYNYHQLTYAQKCFLALLTGQGKEIGFYAVGSDDYHLSDDLHSWKSSIKDFKHDYPWGEIIIGDVVPRTTKQIARAAYDVIKNKPNRIIKNDIEYFKNLPNGNRVTTQITQDAVSELQYVIDEVKLLLDSGVLAKEIGLVFYNPKYIGVFARLLKEIDIPYCGQTKRSVNCSDNGISLSSLSMVKNQFFDYVFLIGMDMHISDEKENRLNSFFVGMTRARKQLYLTMAKERKGSIRSIKDQEILKLFQIPNPACL